MIEDHGSHDDPGKVEQKKRLEAIRAYLERGEQETHAAEKLVLLREAASIYENDLGQPG